MYEVTLGTAGIQQLGWAAHGSTFTNEGTKISILLKCCPLTPILFAEDGVGDSPDSYAFDGKRVTIDCNEHRFNAF